MERVIYALALAVVTTIRALPLPVCFALGQAIGVLLYLVLPPYRRLARQNLTKAFAPEKSPAELRALTFRHFVTLGANACSAFKVASMTEDELRHHHTIDGLEHVKNSLARGNGLVLMISHIGNWELFAQANFHARPWKTSAIYQSLRNKQLDDLINRDRRAKGTATFDRKRGLNKALTFLKEGNLVAVLVDQHAGDSGLWTPFFNALASTSPLAASLATRTGAPIVPMAIFSDGFAKWRISARPAIPYDPDRPEQLTFDVNAALESQIRESPADWFWVHNRWKIPHPDFLLARTKRGVYLPPATDPASLKPFRILIRSSNWLGDAVMSAPAVRAIAAGRPDAKVTVLTREKLADFWRTVPGVADVIAVPSNAGVFRVASRIRGRFDVAILFPNSSRAGLEVWLAGIRRRVGYEGEKRKWMLNQIVRPGKKRMWPQHQAYHYLRMADSVGAERGELTIPPAPIPEGPLRIGICPGAEYGPAKRWYPNRFRRTMQAIAEKHPDATFVILGTATDAEVARDVLEGFTGNVEDLVGRTSLAQLLDELRRLRTLVTNDTGTMHLAASLGVPVVALFGSTEPLLTGPLGDHHIVIRHQVECSPCYQRDCPLDFRCMEAISTEEVTDAVEKILSRQG
ncbi:MAG: lipopolysaccharide heptosyltransferase II [Chthoniobacterales bacterium]